MSTSNPSPSPWVTTEPSQSHSTSTSSPLLQNELQAPNVTMYNPKTATLEFEEFSYVNEQGIINGASGASLQLLFSYLDKYYGAYAAQERLPYLAVWCEDRVPPPSERPFIIAGLVAIWLVHGKDRYPEYIDLGDVGHSEDRHWLWLEQNLLADLDIFVIPKAETLSAIMNQYFPEAVAISYFDYRVIVELKETDKEQHKKRLDSLPHAFAKTEVNLRYHNGPIQGQELNDSALHTNSLSKINETFWIDSFGTGPQQLASNGRRVYKVNSLSNEPSAPPGPGELVELVQNLFSTSAPDINGYRLIMSSGT